MKAHAIQSVDDLNRTRFVEYTIRGPRRQGQKFSNFEFEFGLARLHPKKFKILSLESIFNLPESCSDDQHFVLFDYSIPHPRSSSFYFVEREK